MYTTKYFFSTSEHLSDQQQDKEAKELFTDQEICGECGFVDTELFLYELKRQNISYGDGSFYIFVWHPENQKRVTRFSVVESSVLSLFEERAYLRG